MALPNLLADMPRHCDTVFNTYALNRNKGHDIGGAKPRMGALMLIQVDQLCSFADATNSGFLHGFAFPDQRDYATIVVGIHFAIKKEHTIKLHGFNNGINFGFVPAFGKIRDTLHESLHKREEYPARVRAASSSLTRRVCKNNPE